MEKLDLHLYDNGLPPVRLELLEHIAAVQVRAAARIPCHREIRRVVAATYVSLYALGLCYSSEGGIEGSLFHPDMDGTHPVCLTWQGSSDYEISLLPGEAWESEGEHLIAGEVFNLLETALFRIARDEHGYPLILSSQDEVLVRHVLLEAVRAQAGGHGRDRVEAFLLSPQGRHIQLAGQF